MHHFNVDEFYANPNELPQKVKMQLGDEDQRVFLYNPLANERTQVVTLRLNVYNIEVIY